MRILIVMDPGILVPPKGYGGHERLVYMFAKEYVRAGHEVDLLVTEGSEVEGCTTYPIGPEGFPPTKKVAQTAILTAWKFIWKNRNRYALIHNFGRLFYLMPVLNSKINKIQTYGREISSRNINIINSLPNKNMIFTGCSNDLISRVTAGGKWKAVYNAIPFSKYELQSTVPTDAPFIFLGRVEKIKGCHTAIAVVKKIGAKLIIAGNISPLEEEQEYYKTMIEPYIDGVQINYIGAVDDEQKNYWLGRCRALLMPIEWNEPFGIVMIEAMACGTPVMAFNRGSVEEVVEEGITGYKVNTESEMIDAVSKLASIDRKKCRVAAESRFDVSVIAAEYLNLHTK